MSFVLRGEAVAASHTVEELKLVYRVLHAHLTEHLELMDTHFLLELQRFLQDRAIDDGVDPSDHSAWDVWLGNADAPTCDERMARRKRLGDQDS